MRNPGLLLTHPEASRERLLAFARKIPGAYIGIKIAALLLIMEGQRPGWISEVLGLTRQSLNVWMHKVNEKGIESLKADPRPGRPPRLTPEMIGKVEQHLEKTPLEFGLKRLRWDGPTLVVHLQRQFGVKLKVRQAQNWMHQVGYRLKRASYSYLQAKAEDAKRFRRALKKTPLSGA
jgi:transposase